METGDKECEGPADVAQPQLSASFPLAQLAETAGTCGPGMPKTATSSSTQMKTCFQGVCLAFLRLSGTPEGLEKDSKKLKADEVLLLLQ